MTLEELKHQGYVFDNYATCKYCNEDIEWWLSPRGKKVPFNSMSGGRDQTVNHLTECSGRY